MPALPNQMSESRHSHRFVPLASASAEGQLSDLLDPDQRVRGVPSADNRIRAKGQVTIAAIHAASLTAAPMAEPVLSAVLRIVTP
jgi:hypothetical protein